MCPSLIEIGSKTAEKNSAQTNKQTLTEVDEWLTLPYYADDDDSGSLCGDGG